METKYGGALPQWRYRAIAGPARRRNSDDDGFRFEAREKLAAAGLPSCFGEMSYPHWRAVAFSQGSQRSVCYHVDSDVSSRRVALDRLILCSRCPVFGRCQAITMAKKSVNPVLAARKERANLLSALGRM